MEKNYNTHIYLYAKGHYNDTNVIEDLKIIMAERCGQYSLRYQEGRCDLRDVISVLVNLTYSYIRRHDYLFQEFVSDVSPDNSWKVGYRTKQMKTMFIEKDHDTFPEYDYWTAVIYKCLSILRHTTVTEILEVDGRPIGEADYELFPMFKKEEN